MNGLRHIHLLLIGFLFLATNLYCQKKDNAWFLAGNFDYSGLDQYDKQLLDSVLTVYHKNTGDSVQLTCLHYLSENLQNGNLWPEYSKLIIKRTENKKSKFFIKLRATAYNNLALDYFNNSNIQAAIKGFQASLHLDSSIGDYKTMANTLTNLAYIYTKTGNVKAAGYYEAAIKTAESNKDYDIVGKSKSSLASLYFLLGEDSYGLKLCLEAIEILKKNNAYASLAGAYNTLGHYYHEKNNLERAYYFYIKSLDARKKTKDKEGLVSNLGNIGSIYLARKEYEKAKSYFDEQLKISEELGQDLLVAYSHDNISSYYKRIKDYNNAEKHSLITLKLGNKLSSPEVISRAADYLHEIYKIKKNYAKSLDMLELQYRMEDSLSSQTIQKMVFKQQYRLEFEKKEAQVKENARIEKEKIAATTREEKRIQNIITISVSVGFFLTLILAIVIFRSLQQNKNKNRIISQQKKLVEEKQKEVIDSIKYAQRIQKSLLPTNKYISKNLNKLNNKG